MIAMHAVGPCAVKSGSTVWYTVVYSNKDSQACGSDTSSIGDLLLQEFGGRSDVMPIQRPHACRSMHTSQIVYGTDVGLARSSTYNGDFYDKHHQPVTKENSVL